MLPYSGTHAPRGDQIALEIAGTRAGGIRNDQQKRSAETIGWLMVSKSFQVRKKAKTEHKETPKSCAEVAK